MATLLDPIFSPFVSYFILVASTDRLLLARLAESEKKSESHRHFGSIREAGILSASATKTVQSKLMAKCHSMPTHRMRRREPQLYAVLPATGCVVLTIFAMQ